MKREPSAPAGRLGLLTWRPDTGVHDLFKVMSPFSPPPAPGVGSPFDWGHDEHLRELLGDTFELTFEDGASDHTADSAEAYWQLMSTSYGPTKTLAGSLEPDRREELHRAFVGFFENYENGEGMRWPRPYLLVLGERRSVTSD